MKSNLIFIGMPAVGKSTVGIVVAKRLGKGFIDSDLLIQEQEGKLLREIIAEVGDDGFLKIENQVNRDIKAENAVISLSFSAAQILMLQTLAYQSSIYESSWTHKDEIDKLTTLEEVLAYDVETGWPS